MSGRTQKQIGFKVSGLDSSLFDSLMNMSDEELAELNACWLTADSYPGYPCRVSLQDIKKGEKVLALNYQHHDVKSPYRASGPIFVGKHSRPVEWSENQIPDVMVSRLLSLRGYDKNGDMQEACVTQGEALTGDIIKILSNPQIAYIHAHNTIPGCFACRIDRV
ncbi:DUF1203 domain-containing protein [Aliikangiella sp. G2MR2-5]|uniref:DUF1203 domain-containing protein n=1 Tax=Aliikangiella sp. G2MR2-5 TaxID=2788943 RepID=UPI001AED927B|nr:DUF1203 domain-containing protein [Aliikangiella sp. G2MR2-5]